MNSTGKIMKLQELLELAVSDLEDFAANNPSYACHFCKYNYGDEFCPESRPCFVWEHIDKVKKILNQIGTNKQTAEIKANLDSNDWIPCSERLPEDNTIVLYVWRSKNGNVSVFHGWHFGIRGLGTAWHQSGVGMERPDDEVTHWMPLPDPPKDVDANG